MSRNRGPHFKKIRRLGALPGLTNKRSRAGSDLRNQSRSKRFCSQLLEEFFTEEEQVFSLTFSRVPSISRRLSRRRIWYLDIVCINDLVVIR